MSRSDGTREFVVVLGALDEPDITRLRELGARVLDHAQRHRAIPALDQHIGHGVGERLSAADGEQVLLALGFGVLDQRDVIKLV